MRDSIKSVIFDAGGVLYDWKSAYKKFTDEHGIPYEEFFTLLMRYAPEAEHAQISFLELLRKTLTHFGKADLAQDFRAVVPSTFSPIQPTIDLIQNLHGRLSLAILTNNPPGIMDEWFETHPYKHLFDVIVDSSVVKVRKPDPRIFEIVCERLKLFPHTCLYLEDSKEHVDAAKSLGFQVELVEDIKTSIERIHLVLQI